MKSKLLIIHILFFSFLFQAYGQTSNLTTEYLTTADGEGADIYIKPNLTNRQNTLQVKNNERGGGDPGLTTKTYLRFDVSSLGARLDRIQDAGLQLVTSRNERQGTPTATRIYVFGLTDESLDNWDEEVVVWDDAPANDVTSNGFIEGKVIALGSIEVPANEPPDIVGYTSMELANFIKTDTNGLVTLILRREDSIGSLNLWLNSKEDAIASGNVANAPTLEIVLPIDPDRPFHQVVDGLSFRDDYMESDWFGRFLNVTEGLIQNSLGYLETSAAFDESSMFLWAFDLNQWIWTAKSVYPHLYLMGDAEWVYAHEEPGVGTFFWKFENGDWEEQAQIGWQYPFTDQEITERFVGSVASQPHPRILLSLDDLPALREKVTQGWLADAYSLLKGRAVQQAALFASSYDFAFSATVGRRMQDTIATLALAGYIEDDVSYIRTAINFTLHQIRTYSYEEFGNNNPGSPPLSYGDVLHGLAIAYDWLYPHMTESERLELRTYIEEFGTLAYNYLRGRYTGTSPVADSSNHNSVGNGGLGMAAIALGDKPQWFDQSIQQMRRYLEYSSDDEGWNFEGRSYFNYGGWGGFPFVSAIAELGGPDLFAEYPKYNSVAVDFLLRQMPPYVGASGTAATMPFIMKSRDRVGLWTWLNANGENGNGSYGAGGAGINFLAYNLLWADPELQPLAPMDADLPLDKVFPSDRALFRDGWDLMDAVVTFTTGWNMHPGHRVRNDNSFNFYALGEQFGISPSDAQTRMEVLNSLVMVDEPRRTRDGQEFRYGAAFETVETNEHFAYLKSDASESPVYYLEPDGWTSPEKRKVTEAMRHLLFARSPDGMGQPYMLIMDDLTATADSAKFSWLFQTRADNLPVVLDDSGNSFQITGSSHGNLLDVDFLAPDGLSNEFLSHEGRDEIKGRWSDQRIMDTLTTISTSITGKSVRFIALLRAHEAGTTPPSYTFTGTPTDGQIVVSLADGSTDTITIQGDTITFTRESLF